MHSMSKKKKPQLDGEPMVRSGVALHVTIDPELAAALADYLAESDPKIPKTSAVESALRAFLSTKGHWPRKKPSPGEQA